MEQKDAIPTERCKRKDEHDHEETPSKKPRIEADPQPQSNSAESSNLEKCGEPSRKSEGCRCQPHSNSAESSNLEMCAEPSHKSEGCRCQPQSNSAESSNLEKCGEPSRKSEGCRCQPQSNSAESSNLEKCAEPSHKSEDCRCQPSALVDVTNKSEEQRLNSEQDSFSPPNSGEWAKAENSTLCRYPVIWAGLLSLKEELAKVQMHFVSGNVSIAEASLPGLKDAEFPVIRINKRMKLEQEQIQQFRHKMQMGEHCLLVALPTGIDHKEVVQQAVNVRVDFINYLQLKEAAGIVDVTASESGKRTHVIHMFPPCPLINEILGALAPDLVKFGSTVPHLVVVIAIV